MHNRNDGPGGLRRGAFLASTLGALAAASGCSAAGSASLVQLVPESKGPASLTGASSGFFVPHDSVAHTQTWMAWPDDAHIWGSLLPAAQSDIASIANTITKYEPVTLCANSASVAKARSMCSANVTVIGSIPVNDCWMRDSGPIFRVNGAGGLDIVGLNFNGWGGKQVHGKDALVARRVASYLGLHFAAASLVSEGGAIETDGAGTLMATRSSIVNPNRNPGKSQSQLQADMCAAYGAKKVLWFPGIYHHDITDDHVDSTSRFLRAGRGAVQVPPVNEHDIWAHDERQQYAILSSAKDALGQPIAVTPIAGPVFGKIRQHRHPAFVDSYANYYVCNGAVVAAQFGDAETDAAAKATLESLFPGRVVEQLNVDALGLEGGGIHCVTQQQPRAQSS